jgi:hypothetical protein
MLGRPGRLGLRLRLALRLGAHCLLPRHAGSVGLSASVFGKRAFLKRIRIRDECATPGSLCAQLAQNAVSLMTWHRFGDEDHERVRTKTNPQDLIRRVTGEGPHGHLVWVVREDRPWCILPHVVTDSLVRCPEAGRLLVGVAVAAVDHAVRPNLRGALIRNRPFWGLRTASASRQQERHCYGHGSALHGNGLPSGHNSETSNVQRVFPSCGGCAPRPARSKTRRLALNLALQKERVPPVRSRAGPRRRPAPPAPLVLVQAAVCHAGADSPTFCFPSQGSRVRAPSSALRPLVRAPGRRPTHARAEREGLKRRAPCPTFRGVCVHLRRNTNEASARLGRCAHCSALAHVARAGGDPHLTASSLIRRAPTRGAT